VYITYIGTPADYNNMEPNEYADEYAIGELIIRAVSNKMNVEPRKHDEESFHLFFVTMFLAFTVCALAHVMSFLPREVEILHMFLDEMYGVYVEEDVDIVTEILEDVQEVQKPALKYEDKYVESIGKMAKKELSAEYVEGLMNNFVMESTPSGNVMMRYNSVKGSFEYYSDNIIPNRFLDVVSRKFVTMYDCTALYDAEEAEPNAPTASKESKESKDEKSSSGGGVFAKFKTYNNSSSNKASSASAPTTVMKKNIPAKEVISSNRYTSCGKMANMMMLKKVDRKIVDKTYGMSFADFKQLKNS
jgi:hypothetical protein